MRMLLALLLIPAVVAAAEPTAEDLMARAPVLRTADPAVRSLEASGIYKPELQHSLRFRVLYRAPDRLSVLWADAADGTPISYWSGGRLMVYDPIIGRVGVDDDRSCAFVCLADSDGLKIGAFYGSGEPGHGQATIDIASFIKRAAVRTEVAGDRGGYRLARTTALGGRLVARVDLARPQPYTRLAVMPAGSVDPVFALELVVLNGELGDSLFAIPAKSRLAEGAVVTDWRGTIPDEWTGNGILRMARVISARRLATGSPEGRERAEFKGVDWEQVRAADAKHAAFLRGIVPSR